MPPFDAVLLLSEYGDADLVRDLARLIIETTPPQVDAVQEAVGKGDARALKAAAHKLRGSIVNFGVPAAVETAKRLEAMGDAGDLAGADELSRRLAAEVQLLRDSAKAWLDAGGALPS